MDSEYNTAEKTTTAVRFYYEVDAPSSASIPTDVEQTGLVRVTSLPGSPYVLGLFTECAWLVPRTRLTCSPHPLDVCKDIMQQIAPYPSMSVYVSLAEIPSEIARIFGGEQHLPPGEGTVAVLVASRLLNLRKR